MTGTALDPRISSGRVEDGPADLIGHELVRGGLVRLDGQEVLLPKPHPGVAEYVAGTRVSDQGALEERAIVDEFLEGRLRGMRRWSASRSSPTCATPWSAMSFCSITSPRSISAAIASSAWRRWCAGAGRTRL
jgi:hypothetical protein